MCSHISYITIDQNFCFIREYNLKRNVIYYYINCHLNCYIDCYLNWRLSLAIFKQIKSVDKLINKCARLEWGFITMCGITSGIHFWNRSKLNSSIHLWAYTQVPVYPLNVEVVQKAPSLNLLNVCQILIRNVNVLRLLFLCYV